MLRFVVRRLLSSIPVLFGILLVTFAIARVIPGDPCQAALQERASETACADFNERFGFNDPILVQFVDYVGDVCIIPPNSFALARTVEYFRIPRKVLTICLGKSTYARCGIIVNVTPLEPEWEGQVTLEFSNTTNLPAKIYANEGIAQMLFFESDEECEVSYRDRAGKYLGQTGVTLPKT